MAYFQIELLNDVNKNKSYEYFEADSDEKEKACEILDKLGHQLPRVMVREYNPSTRKRVKDGREFIIVFKQYNVTLSTGRIISEQWYQPAQWER